MSKTFSITVSQYWKTGKGALHQFLKFFLFLDVSGAAYFLGAKFMVKQEGGIPKRRRKHFFSKISS